MFPWSALISVEAEEISVVRTPSLCFEFAISDCRPRILESSDCCCSDADWPMAAGTPKAIPSTRTRASRENRRVSRTEFSFAGRADVPARRAGGSATRTSVFYRTNALPPTGKRSGFRCLGAPFPPCLGRRGRLRVGCRLVRGRLGNLRRLGGIALVRRRPRLGNPGRLRRRLHLLGRAHARLGAVDLLFGAFDEGLDLGLLFADSADDRLDGRPCLLHARFVLVEHRLAEPLKGTHALALELRPLAAGAKELDLPAAPGGESLTAGGEARRQATQDVLRRATLIGPRGEEDDRTAEQRDEPPRPYAGREEHDRPDENRPADDEVRVGRPELPRRRPDQRFGRSGELPAALRAVAAALGNPGAAVRAVRHVRRSFRAPGLARPKARAP